MAAIGKQTLWGIAENMYDLDNGKLGYILFIYCVHFYKWSDNIYD